MSLIKNLPIRYKIIIIFIIPFIAMIFFLTRSLSNEIANHHQLKKTSVDITHARDLSMIINEVQLERDLAATLLSHSKSTEQKDLHNQIKIVDSTLNSTPYNEIIADQKGKNLIYRLGNLREKMKPGPHSHEMIHLYDGFIETLIDSIDLVSNRIVNPEIKELLQSHAFLLYAKEFFNRTGTLIISNFHREEVKKHEIAQLGSSFGKYDIKLKKFEMNASDEVIRFYEACKQNNAASNALQIIDLALKYPDSVSSQYSLNEEWAAITAYNNLLQKVSNYSANHTVATAGTFISQLQQAIITDIAIGIILILTTIALIFYLTRHMASSIEEIKNAADSMALGETDLSLSIRSGDEIGGLAKSLTQLINTTKSFAEVANKIGQGDYLSEDIKLRGKNDTLGLALNAMKNNLIRFSEEGEKKTWLLKGSSELNVHMRGDKNINELTNGILYYLCPYLNLQMGAIYLKRDEFLELEGSYAYRPQNGMQDRFQLGEGLIGQSALEKKSIVFADIPDNYIKVISGLGQGTPKNIIEIPLIYNEDLIGVMELASTQEFNKLRVEFLKNISESIAIAIASAQNKHILSESLEKIRHQKMEMEKISFELTQQVDCLNNAAIVSITDPDGNITYVNDLFCTISKYSKEELLGKNHRLLKSEKQPDGLFVGMWKAISLGKIWHGEILNKAKDGSYYWVDTTIMPFRGVGGEIEKYVAIRFDITKQKHQAEELKKLLEETQRQAEALEIQQEELRRSNEELREKTELLEQSEDELLTQQKGLQQANSELDEKASLLEEQKRKLEEAKMDIETKARELEITGRYKSEFLANMSHELRTPLNSILILAQILSENKNRNLDQREIEFAKNIYSSGSDLLGLINQILDLSKIEAGKVELEIAELNVNEMHNHLRQWFGEIAKRKSVEFNIDLKDQKLKENITTDKQRLKQILRNLLSNAFKFTGKGGKVSIQFQVVPTHNDIISNTLKKLPEVLRISVGDSGIGIPNNKQSHVFEAFQQADGSTKRKYGGTGLGLSISRELVSILGGEIHLESKEGEGSTFRVYLPLQFDRDLVREFDKKVVINKKTPREHEHALIIKPQKEKLEEIADDRYEITKKDKVILIIEDDQSFLKLLLDFAHQRNLKAILARQGNAGLSLARHYHPHAIILDMKLPIIDGLEVLKHLKNDPELRHIPVQIITGYDTQKKGMELGAFDFVRKPINMDDLKNTFDKLESFVNKKKKQLLVIEDNEQQNKTIRELIGNVDVTSYSAFSGNQAIELLGKKQFDCMIMDPKLPDMDGLELLKNIEMQKLHDRLPVVVYTHKTMDKKMSYELAKLGVGKAFKTADSIEKLLDESTLLLHRMESHLSPEKQDMLRKLHRTNEVLKNKKVLIVDDDIRNIYSLSNALEDEGLKCLAAENGVEAISKLKKNPDINIVLMDIMMPEMDGMEATFEIRNLDKFAKLPIIALTAKAMKGDYEECLSAGMSDYIAKPVDIKKLLSMMRVWLRD